MEAVTMLKEEHIVILDFLDQLTLAGERIVKDKFPPKEFFETAVDFARTFADKFHHYKEEDIMFRILAQKHSGSLDGQLEKLRQQHEQCRDYMTAISASAEGCASGSDGDARILHRNLADYVTTLRKHINFENVTFFPLIARELSSDELDALAVEFRKWDEKMGGMTLENGKKIVKSLAESL